MDKQHRNYYDYLQSSRISNERTRERRRREHHDKQLLKVKRDMYRLRDARRNQEWVALQPPIMRGYLRHFVLRADVAASKQAAFYQGILDRINTEQHSYRKDFRVKKKRWGKKTWKIREQQLQRPLDREFRRMNFTAAEAALFEERETPEHKRKYHGATYVFREPWRFTLRVRPNMITKMQLLDEQVESDLKRLENYVERNGLRPRLDRIMYKPATWYRRDLEPKAKEVYKHLPLQVLLNNEWFNRHEL
ncbi:hypothetical protein F0L74_05060 [Chitinophaga agrisoli]|uniref:Uncharacterized protein n=1 Tax=Chitinophaga agrisoli TaxID=2607653 RepID=A0A5B2W2M4_9BACT|nr:hypothetical protein [Chitinophaga agrisoli]KAA2245334.1 hypothetical protein F0L74_05060 [Chitinophaga agrisoli]